MENHQSSSAAAPNGNGGSGSSENKDDAVPNLGTAVEVTATVATSTDHVSKGKSVAADDDKELKPHIIAERNRRNRMKDYFGELQALVPEIPEKSDKATIVGHVINYIQSLEKTMATLEKRKKEKAAASSIASSSAAPPPPPPQTAQGMALAAMSADVPNASSAAPPLPQPLAAAAPVPAISSDVPQPLQQPVAAADQPALPPECRIITTRQVAFQTWTWPNLVLSVSNGNAYVSVSAPRHRGMWTMVMVVSVLNKYGIDVVTAQIDADDVRSVFNICARVTATGGENPSAPLEVYQLAVSEILVWLTTN